MAPRVDGGQLAASIGDVDVEAGGAGPAAEAPPQEARAEDPWQGASDEDASDGGAAADTSVGGVAPRAGGGGMAASIGGADAEAGRTIPTAQAAPEDSGEGLSSSSSVGGAAAEPLAHGPDLLMVALGVASLIWTLYFHSVVSPDLEEHTGDDQQLRQSCISIVVYFYLFAIVRVLMQVKPIGRLLQAALRGRFGSSVSYLTFVMLYCPLLMFTVGSIALYIHVSITRGEHEDAELTRTVSVFCFFSLLMAIMSWAATLWNAYLAIDAGRQIQKTCSVDLITRIPTVPYDPNLFGAEDGMRYHGDCSICLGEFEAEDEISVPTCGHAFHTECLGHWLRSHRTCALCRRDVAQASEAGAEGAGSDAEVAARRGLEEAARRGLEAREVLGARVRGLEEATPGDEAPGSRRQGLEEAAPGDDAAARSGAVRV